MTAFEKSLRIVCAVLITLAALALASLFVDTDTSWYQALQKPQLQPPPIVFGIVWTALYLLFAASLSLISINAQTPQKTYALYLAVFVLNAFWTYAFFYRQSAAAAVFVLLMLIAAAVSLFLAVYRTNRLAAYLLIPYLLWIVFALYLNYEIAFLN